MSSTTNDRNARRTTRQRFSATGLASLFGMHVGLVRFRRRGQRPEKRFLLPFDIDLLAVASLLVLFGSRLAAFGADGSRLVGLCSQISVAGFVCPGPFPDYVVCGLAAFSCLRLCAWSLSDGEPIPAAGLACAAVLTALPYDAMPVDARMAILTIAAGLAATVAWLRADALVRGS